MSGFSHQLAYRYGHDRLATSNCPVQWWKEKTGRGLDVHRTMQLYIRKKPDV